MTYRYRATAGALRWRLLIGTATTAFLGACSLFDSLLDVEPQEAVTAASVETPGQAALLVNSAVADFDCAFTNYAMAGGLVADEVDWGDLNTFDYDRRTFTSQGGNFATSKCATGIGAGGLGVYTPLSTARWSANNVHRLLTEWTDAQVPNRGVLLATTSAYSGYGHLLLGEAMCGAAIDAGPQLNRTQLWEQAVAKFTTAISEAQAASNTAMLNMAYLGRARARLQLGQKPEAVTDAQRIPDGFVQNSTFAGTSWRSSNQAWQWIAATGGQIRAAIAQGYWNLSVDGVADSRVRVTLFPGRFTQDGVTPQAETTKYPLASSPVAIAKWAEAQLIIAEVQGGQTAVGIVNELHRRANLPTTFASTNAQTILAQVLEEKRRELFLESQRFGDMLRLSIPFTPAAGVAYKLNNGVYGSMTCFPFPDVERDNNPNAGG